MYQLNRIKQCLLLWPKARYQDQLPILVYPATQKHKVFSWLYIYIYILYRDISIKNRQTTNYHLFFTDSVAIRRFPKIPVPKKTVAFKLNQNLDDKIFRWSPILFETPMWLTTKASTLPLSPGDSYLRDPMHPRVVAPWRRSKPGFFIAGDVFSLRNTATLTMNTFMKTIGLWCEICI